MSLKKKTQRKKIYSYFKRFMDIITAIILLILTAIPMLIVAIAILIEDGRPVIYKSKRIGKGQKPFYVYKFRSMKKNRKELEGTMTHDEMVTKVGKFIRKTSLDELPQLFNVLKGEMSFIGPRPWVPEYFENFTESQKHRVDVLPGISGLAQVKGRNGISIFDKINYDLWYADNMSFKLDMKLVVWTILAVFKGTGAEITEKGIKNEIRLLGEKKENIDKEEKQAG